MVSATQPNPHKHSISLNEEEAPKTKKRKTDENAITTVAVSRIVSIIPKPKLRRSCSAFKAVIPLNDRKMDGFDYLLRGGGTDILTIVLSYLSIHSLRKLTAELEPLYFSLKFLEGKSFCAPRTRSILFNLINSKKISNEANQTASENITKIINTAIIPVKAVDPKILHLSPVLIAQLKGRKRISLIEISSLRTRGFSMEIIFKLMGRELETLDLENRLFRQKSYALSILEYAGLYCPNLKTLKLPVCTNIGQEDNTSSVIETFWKNSKNWIVLERLSFYVGYIEILRSVICRGIKTLDIESLGVECSADQVLGVVAETCPAIENLKLTGLPEDVSMGLRHISNSCPKLRQLRLIQESSEPLDNAEEGIIEILKKCKELHSLYLIKVSITSSLLKAIAEHGRNMSILTVNLEEREKLMPLLQQICPNLKVIWRQL